MRASAHRPGACDDDAAALLERTRNDPRALGEEAFLDQLRVALGLPQEAAAPLLECLRRPGGWRKADNPVAYLRFVARRRTSQQWRVREKKRPEIPVADLHIAPPGDGSQFEEEQVYYRACLVMDGVIQPAPTRFPLDWNRDAVDPYVGRKCKLEARIFSDQGYWGSEIDDAINFIHPSWYRKDGRLDWEAILKAAGLSDRDARWVAFYMEHFGDRRGRVIGKQVERVTRPLVSPHLDNIRQVLLWGRHKKPPEG